MRSLSLQGLPDKRRLKVLVPDWPDPEGPSGNEVKTRTIYTGVTNGTERNQLIGGNYAYARLVHIPDDASRKELLIIFMEDLSPTGWTGEDLREGGEHEDRWSEVEAAHLDRIKRVISLSRSG